MSQQIPELYRPSGTTVKSGSAWRVAVERLALDNCPMRVSRWQKRIARARELSRRYPAATEILEFYAHVAGFQEDLHRKLETVLPRQARSSSFDGMLNSNELAELSSRFESFLTVAAKNGPSALRRLSHELTASGKVFRSKLLSEAWSGGNASDAQGFLAMAYVQPYAELLRSDIAPVPRQTAYALCPFCHRKPGIGVLRQMGDGAARSMICCFCLAEWEFRRLVCPGCGEENDRKLSVFTANEFDHIRIEGCETCKTYIKTVDLTKDGHAEPIVDDIASASLDLWAADRGYAKLQRNILGM